MSGGGGEGSGSKFGADKVAGHLLLPVESSGLVCLVSLEGDLQDAVAQPVAVEARDGHGRLIVIRHGDEAEAFALIGVEVTDHLDIVDRAERAEQLPEHALVRVRGQVVHKDAPTGACVPGDVHAHQAGHAVNGDRGKPKREEAEWWERT